MHGTYDVKVTPSFSFNEIRKQSTMRVTCEIFEKEYMAP